MNIKRVIIGLCLISIVCMLVVGGVLGVLFNVSFVEYEGELSAGEEIFKYNTNPLSVDSDSDDLSDYQEIKVYNSDPLNKHSDNDGIYDGQEVEIGANPTKMDTDEDGLDDGQEVKLNTAPDNSDTDGDGLSDYKEFNEFKTSPTNANTDNDYLNDYEEIKEYDTNPIKSDTSEDGFKDGLLEEANEEYPNLYKDDLDPTKQHIFLYVSRTEGASIPKQELEYIEELFESNNQKEIEMHIVYNDKPISKDSSLTFKEFRNIHQKMEIDNMGYHHLVLVDKIGGQGEDVVGITKISTSAIMVKEQDNRYYGSDVSSDTLTGITILHEITHSLGMTNSDFDGVDSKKYSYNQYPSVMNYNYPNKTNYNLSSGQGFDDWKYIEDNMVHPDTSKLEQQIKQE